MRTELLVKQREELAVYSQEQQIKKLLLQDHAPALELYQHALWLTQKYPSRVQRCDDYDSLKARLVNFKQQLIKRASDYYDLGNEEYMKIPETHFRVITLTAGLRLHQQALVLRLALLGEKHEDTACSYQNIGVIQKEMEDVPSRFASHKRALDIRRKLLGENHPDTAKSYNNIGVAQEHMKDYTSALESCQHALHIRREQFGENHPQTADSYHAVGVAQEDMKDYTSALDSYQRAPHIRRELFGENHPKTADSCHSIGVAQERLKDYTSAVESYQRALDNIANCLEKTTQRQLTAVIILGSHKNI